MAKKKNRFCAKKQFRRFITPSLCSVCDRLWDCRAFKEYYRKEKTAYNRFVHEMVQKFPEKYSLEVILMAEKQQFVQIMDKKTGRVEQIIDLQKLEQMSAEEKLALSKGKAIYVITHELEPIIKIEMKRKAIAQEVQFEEEKPEVVVEPELATKSSSKRKTK